MFGESSRQAVQLRPEDLMVDIAPNEIRISSSRAQIESLHIYNELGDVVFLCSEKSSAYRIALPEPGLYFLACTINGAVDTRRIKIPRKRIKPPYQDTRLIHLKTGFINGN